MARALAAQAERVADAVRHTLSDPPGAGGHDQPWLQSGALRDSMGASPKREAFAAEGEEVARSVAEAVVAALKGEPAENGAVMLAGASTSGQAPSVPYNPFGVLQPGPPENEEWTRNPMRLLRGLGHIFHSEPGDGKGEDKSGSPEEKGTDPVKPTFKPNEAHNPRNQNYNPNKDPEPPDAEEVYKDARRDPNPDKRVWYGKNAKGEWYQYREDNTEAAYYAGTIKRERVPISICRGRK